MKQLIPRVQVGLSGTTSHFPALGVATIDFFTNHRAPMPWAVTARNLVMTSGDTARAGAITQTLQKNAVDTALLATLPALSSGPVSNTIDEVTFAQFDDCRWKFVNAAGSAPFGGNMLGYCVELESQGNVYGIGANIFGSVPVGVGGIGGALGNGFWNTYDHATWGGYSTGYSICSTPGTLTHLAIRTYSTPPPIGEGWIAFYRVDGIIQDGSGGTVDTRCVIVGDGSTDRAVSTFSLPIVPPNRVEVLYYRTGGAHPFTLDNHIGAGVGFVPTIAGAHMLTGGSNTLLALPGFVWPLSRQSETDETLAQAPIGPGGFRATGLYIEAPTPGPNPGDQITRWLRNTGVDTPILVVMTNLETSGLITGQAVDFVSGNFISMNQRGTGDGTSLYWGLALIPTPLDGTIIVVKDASGDTTTPFDFTTVGLAPGAFQLVGGAQQVFSAVPIGTGYGVSEVPPAEWQLDSIQVSNGDLPTNITILGGDIVTVTFLNSLRRGAEACPQPNPAPVAGQKACPTPSPSVV